MSVQIALCRQVKKGFIFWEQDLRVAGSGTPAVAASRLTSLLSARRFGSGKRLSGVMAGSQFRVWHTSALTTEIVECAGVIRAHGEGSVIEGKLRYKLATRIQFAGGLLLGVMLAVAGALQTLAEPPSQSELAPLGFVILAVIVVWIYTSSETKSEQIRYITERLEEMVAG